MLPAPQIYRCSGDHPGATALTTLVLARLQQELREQGGLQGQEAGYRLPGLGRGQAPAVGDGVLVAGTVRLPPDPGGQRLHP